MNNDDAFVCHYDSCACLFSAVVVFFHGFASSSFIFIGLTASGFRTTIIGAVIDGEWFQFIGDAIFYIIFRIRIRNEIVDMRYIYIMYIIFRIVIGFITTSNRNFMPHK